MPFDPHAPRGLALVGVLHLPALPGSPLWGGSMNRVLDQAVRDADAYVQGGFDALIVENYGDRPFAPGPVPPATVAGLTAIASDIRARYPDLPLGINVLRNDARSALAIACVVGAAFIRVNVLVGAMVTDQGIVEGKAWDLALEKRLLGTDVAIWADVMVKHAAPLGTQSLEDQAHDAFDRAGACALVLSGSGTGRPADPMDFARVRRTLPRAPLVVGSGLRQDTIADFATLADAAIVATALQDENGRVEPTKVERFVLAIRAGP